MLQVAFLLIAGFFKLSSGHAARMPANFTQPIDCSKGTFPPVISYHIHILYDCFAEDQVKQAIALQDQARIALKDITGKDCSCATNPMCRDDHDRFCFIIDHPLNTTLEGGPFPSGEWSVFVPVPYMGPVLAWFTDHYQDTNPSFSLLLHPNTGCQYEDHTNKSLWAGQRWPLNTGIFKPYTQTSEVGQTRGNADNPVCLHEGKTCSVFATHPDMACCSGQTCDCGMGGCTCRATTSLK